MPACVSAALHYSSPRRLFDSLPEPACGPPQGICCGDARRDGETETSSKGRWVDANAARCVLQMAIKARRRGSSWLHPEVIRDGVAPFLQVAPRPMPVIVSSEGEGGPGVYALDTAVKPRPQWIPISLSPPELGGVSFSACAATPYGGDLVVSGGRHGRTRDARVSAEAWTADATGSCGKTQRLPPMALPRWAHCSVPYMAGVLVAGGFGEGNVVHNSCELWDPAASAWSPLPPLRRARAGAAACNVRGVVLICGGRDGAGKLVAEVDALLPGADAWVPAGRLTVPRAYAAVCEGVVGGAVSAIVSGGIVGKGRASAAVEAVVPPAWLMPGGGEEDGRTVTLPLLPYPQWGACSAGFRRCCCILGGDPSDPPLSPFLMYFDYETSRWSYTWLLGGPIPALACVPRSGMCASSASVFPAHWVWRKDGSLVQRRGLEIVS
eukprot:TRINITY_DN70798_c0_g1_i1.p1 TRINITY_DN70798_c0_g1~~TRINITY_DN70798_c0_g1_i1.p1  ORF type:complete len:438 (+),score=23.93 TRINITY_DN70798_c0_g1_i1:68-1381(+)